ncbi:MAG: hypothetical protein GWP91_19145, partial [Rhodobacterales bacterium]|nr:hypothetical protein [Rhodobacterales bacterium]
MPLVPAPVSAQSFEEWRWDFGTRRARILAWVLVVGHLSFVLLDFVARPEFAMVFLPTRIAMEIGFLVVLVLIYFDWHRAVPLVVGTTLIGGVGWITALATGPLDVYVGGMYLAVIGATTVLPVFIRWHVGGQIAGISIFVVGQLIHHPEVDGTVIFLVTFILVWVAFVVNLSMHLFAQQIRAELKAKAELVAAYERLAELDQAKTDFFANISHELRTPLTLILGTLRGLGQDGDNAAEQRQVMVGLRNGARLLMLINQLLDMSRMDSGVMEIKPVATDVSALVRHVVSSFDRSGTECQIELVLEPEPVWALIDPGLLRKLLFNLVSNAVKFTSATHGFVRVHLSHLGDGIRLAVDDN